jgi:hypothetical protein
MLQKQVLWSNWYGVTPNSCCNKWIRLMLQKQVLWSNWFGVTPNSCCNKWIRLMLQKQVLCHDQTFKVSGHGGRGRGWYICKHS